MGAWTLASAACPVSRNIRISKRLEVHQIARPGLLWLSLYYRTNGCWSYVHARCSRESAAPD